MEEAPVNTLEVAARLHGHLHVFDQTLQSGGLVEELLLQLLASGLELRFTGVDDALEEVTEGGLVR